MEGAHWSSLCTRTEYFRDLSYFLIGDSTPTPATSHTLIASDTAKDERSQSWPPQVQGLLPAPTGQPSLFSALRMGEGAARRPAGCVALAVSRAPSGNRGPTPGSIEWRYREVRGSGEGPVLRLPPPPRHRKDGRGRPRNDGLLSPR